MKCERIVIYGWKSKKAIKKTPKILLSIVNPDQLNPEIFKIWIISHQEICNGEIESNVGLEGIPFFGGMEYDIEVRFKCKKCGWEHAGDNGLPRNIEEVNKFLTEVISKL